MNNQEAFKIITDYFKDKPVSRVAVFGSYSTGQQRADSDIDLILTLSEPVGLIKLSSYKIELEKKLNIPVDLGTDTGISPFVLPYIQKDIKILYERK
jgi:hypothetical protein